MNMIERRGACPSGLKYLEYTPKGTNASALQSTPKLVFLHGLGEDGEDLDLLKQWGLPKLIDAGLQVPYHVLCPQCPENVAWNLEQVAKLIELQSKGKQSCVFLTGFSKGATAAWKFAAEFANLLAGVVPVAGRWELADAERMMTISVLAVHGARDERPSPAPVVDAINQNGGHARLWALENEGHFISDIVYADPRLYNWLASETLLSEVKRSHEAHVT